MTVTPAARQPPMTAKLYYGSIAHSRSLTELEVVEKALMLVDEHGVIGWVHRDVTSASLLQEVAAEHGLDITRDPVGVVELDEDEFLCPGLIDTHTHAPQYTNIGLGNGVHLLNWLDQLTFPEESKYADVAYAKEVYSEVIRRTLNAGTTTSCYYGTMHLESTKTLVGLCLEKGQRAFVGKCSMDRLCSDTYVETTPDAIQSAQDFIDHFPHLSQQKVSSSSKPNGCAHGHDCGSHGGGALAPLVQPILTPRMAICTTPELLSSISALSASYDPPLAIQTHLDENKDEISTTLSLFPKSQSYASVYEDYGILHDGTILAHCVHLTQEEREVIRRTGAGVSHCPTSNFNLDSGVAKIRELLDMGIKVGLGTDCSGGYSLSLQPVLRLAVHVSQQLGYATKGYKALSVEESFFLATMGGAALCRLQGSIGNFDPGKEFDALRIKPASPGMWVRKGEPVRSRFERWFWSADDRDISEVYVRGRKVGGAGIAVAK